MFSFFILCKIIYNNETCYIPVWTLTKSQCGNIHVSSTKPMLRKVLKKLQQGSAKSRGVVFYKELCSIEVTL